LKFDHLTKLVFLESGSTGRCSKAVLVNQELV